MIRSMSEKVYVELSDGRKGWYIVTEERPDGSLVVVPDKPGEGRPRSDADDAAQDAPTQRCPLPTEPKVGRSSWASKRRSPSGSLYLWQRR